MFIHKRIKEKLIECGKKIRRHKSDLIKEVMILRIMFSALTSVKVIDGAAKQH